MFLDFELSDFRFTVIDRISIASVSNNLVYIIKELDSAKQNYLIGSYDAPVETCKEVGLYSKVSVQGEVSDSLEPKKTQLNTCNGRLTSQ